jgi:hypothetical protein
MISAVPKTTAAIWSSAPFDHTAYIWSGYGYQDHCSDDPSGHIHDIDCMIRQGHINWVSARLAGSRLTHVEIRVEAIDHLAHWFGFIEIERDAAVSLRSGKPRDITSSP